MSIANFSNIKSCQSQSSFSSQDNNNYTCGGNFGSHKMGSNNKRSFFSGGTSSTKGSSEMPSVMSKVRTRLMNRLSEFSDKVLSDLSIVGLRIDNEIKAGLQVFERVSLAVSKTFAVKHESDELDESDAETVVDESDAETVVDESDMDCINADEEMEPSEKELLNFKALLGCHQGNPFEFIRTNADIPKVSNSLREKYPKWIQGFYESKAYEMQTVPVEKFDRDAWVDAYGEFLADKEMPEGLSHFLLSIYQNFKENYDDDTAKNAVLAYLSFNIIFPLNNDNNVPNIMRFGKCCQKVTTIFFVEPSCPAKLDFFFNGAVGGGIG